MSTPLDPQLREQLAARIQYYRELGIYDFYRQEIRESRRPATVADTATEDVQDVVPKAAAKQKTLSDIPAPEVQRTAAQAPDPVAALAAIREDIGECTRCRLHKGRNQIVFGVGDPKAELMFIGEAPGADEDMQGLPFVGRAGQLLTNMIAAMGLRREDVYIANIIKCRPPGNRMPERDECETCSPYLMRQIATIRPKVIVALGAVAAKTLLAINAPMSELRGNWYDFTPQVEKHLRPEEPVKLAVTYHPAFLLRDPRQKKETWKDLQMVMNYLGLKPVAKPAGTE